MVVSMFILCILYVQERERQTSGNPREVAELQHQLELKERERESLVEQLERHQEELGRKQDELEIERIEKESNRQQLVRQTHLLHHNTIIDEFELFLAYLMVYKFLCI